MLLAAYQIRDSRVCYCLSMMRCQQELGDFRVLFAQNSVCFLHYSLCIIKLVIFFFFANLF